MCGIVGYVGKSDCVDLLLDSLRRLEYRGYDSAGMAVFESDTISIVKKRGRLNNLIKSLNEGYRPCGYCGIGHTRWATHGEPSDINSHPHNSGNVTIVHNGIIENYLQIKKYLKNKGYRFETETDSETVAKLLDYNYKDNPIDAIAKTAKQLEGSYALGILFLDRPNEIYAIRKNSPLIVGKGKDGNFIASDVPAIIKHTREYVLLDQNEIAIVKDNSIKFIDFDGKNIEKEILTANWNVESAEKNGFPHFMLKEINEQPEAIRRCISPRIKQGNLDLGLSNLSDEKFSSFEKIHIVACGTAMHAGMVGKYVIEKLARIPVDVDIASEFRYKNPIISTKDLVIIISQSGETADSLAALRLAKERSVFTLAIVNVVGSSIAREADSVFYTWAGPEISVASTKAYTVQITSLYMLAIKLGEISKTLSNDEICELCNEIQDIPNKIKYILKNDDNILQCAKTLQNSHDIFFIGRGVDYCISLESSLKLKEISYIHSEAYAAGELKHGTISLIENNTPVIAIATQTDLYAKTISNVKEVKSRGANVLLLCTDKSEVDSNASDLVIRIPNANNEILLPLYSIVPLQMFAYHTAVLKGCDVDKPRNLAKSVTVE